MLHSEVDVLELRALMYLENGETVWCDESEADAFGAYTVSDDEMAWVADFADYAVGVQFSEKYAEDNELVFVDRVRSLLSKLP